MGSNATGMGRDTWDGMGGDEDVKLE